MTLQETKNRIREIQDTTKDYQDAINGLQNQLIAFVDDVNGVNASVKDGINEKTIVTHSGNAAKNIISCINKSLVTTRGALDQLSTDATKEIQRIVDEYNNSIDPDDTEAEKLSYVTIKLTSVAGCPEASGDSGGNNRRSSGRNNNYGNNWNNDGYTYTPQEDTSRLDYYFSLLSNSDVYSKDIDDWEDEVSKFLKANDLDKVIKSIEINGKEIICTLINGNVYKFTNITNKLDFLKALYAAIEKEMK